MTPLQQFFRIAWDGFLDGGFDEFNLQEALQKSGLGEWREATEAGRDYDVGDMILVLSDAGQEALRSEAARPDVEVA